MNTELIQSLRELQLRMPAIIQQYGSNNEFTQLALANPLAALEQAGYQFTNAAKAEIEQYVRFGPEGLKKLDLLKADLYKQTGEDIDPDDPEKLTDAVMRLLSQTDDKLSIASGKKTTVNPIVLKRDALFKILSNPPRQTDGNWYDDLQPYAVLHPVISLLIAYRKMQAENSRFAPSEQIPVIKEKLKNTPLKNVVFSLQRNDIG